MAPGLLKIYHISFIVLCSRKEAVLRQKPQDCFFKAWHIPLSRRIRSCRAFGDSAPAGLRPWSNYYTYFENVWTKFHHLRSTTLKDHDSAKEAINQAHAYALEQGTFDQKVFYEAFGIFDNQSIEKSLVSENPLVRIFALLDRRLGKRRLLALEDSMEQELDWVRAFYVIRLQAEGLMEANNI